MSSHFTANQFNDGFQAKHLRNWSYGINHPGSHPRTICGYTVPIADARGHLLPCIRRSPCSSPWGSYRSWIWEETSRCDCVDRIRRPEEYGLPPCNIMVARERLCPRTEASATAAAVSQQCFQPAAGADPSKPIEIVIKMQR